jgi:excisionase family DNA binding protein
MDLMDVLGAEEAARALGIGADRMRVLLRTGRLPARKVGGRWVILRRDLPLVAHRAPGRPRRPDGAQVAAGAAR